MTRTFGLAAAKLIAFLCLLPTGLTFWHLRHQLDNSPLVNQWLVASGKHAPGLYGRSHDKGHFYKLIATPHVHRLAARVSDVIQIADSLTIKPVAQSGRPYYVPAVDWKRPTWQDWSKLSRYQLRREAEARGLPSQGTQPEVIAALKTFELELNHTDYNRTNVPCLFNAANRSHCHGDMVVASRSQSQEQQTAFWLQHFNRFVQMKNETALTPTQMVALYPATSLVFVVNVLAAAVYWNDKIPVAQVALLYNAMSGSGTVYEIWRVFTGTTAHFEAWHLGVNMLTLAAQGRNLEGGIHVSTATTTSTSQLYTSFSSISFFLYNVSLIPIVAGIWWLLQWARLKVNAPTGTKRSPTSRASTSTVVAPFDPNRPTVGYSGVLFAWSVVSSLERSKSCPLLLAPDMCFTTYQWWDGLIKFNAAPLVLLVALQVLLPRVSFVGHLAGIIAGYLLHWGLLPLALVQPALLIPLLYMAYLKWIRNIVPPTAWMLDCLSDQSPSTINNSREERSRLRAFDLFQVQLAVLIASVGAFGLFSTLTASFASTMLFWQCMRHSLSLPTSTATVFAKGYVVAAVCVLIFDAMTLGGWLAFYETAVAPMVVVVVRAVVNILCLVAVQTLIPFEAGVLEWTLGFTTLQPCRELANHPWLNQWLVSSSVKPTAAARSAAKTRNAVFAGKGYRLGG